MQAPKYTALDNGLRSATIPRVFFWGGILGPEAELCSEAESPERTHERTFVRKDDFSLHD